MLVRSVIQILNEVTFLCNISGSNLFFSTFQDENLFDDVYSRHFSSSSPTSQRRVTPPTSRVNINDTSPNNVSSSNEILDETVSLDPKGDSSSRMNSFSCDMDMDTYQAELAEATNALLVAEKCKKLLYTI